MAELEDIIKKHTLRQVSKSNTTLFECECCGLRIRAGKGWYVPDTEKDLEKLDTCVSKDTFNSFGLFRRIQNAQEVVFVELSKCSIICLDYKFQIIKKLTPYQKNELILGTKRQVSNRDLGIPPFTERFIAVSYRDHFIRDSYRVFKGKSDECVAFLKFYISEGFSPENFLYKTKFGSLLKFNDITKFEDAIRK